MIKIDYDEVIREADRLRMVAFQCSENNTLIDRLVGELPSYWQGESAQEFIAELNRWKQDNISISSEAEELGKIIYRVANEIRLAELRTVQAINNNQKG